MQAIVLENLEKTYKNIKALDSINLEVNQGELFAYLGPNGAGKTTTIRMMAGLTRPGSGRCFINGFDIKKNYWRGKAPVWSCAPGGQS